MKEYSSEKPTTLQDIARIAKAVTLEQGFHIPTLISEGDQQIICTQIEDFESLLYEKRAPQMFLVGLALAQSGEVGVLQQVFFISEAWMSVTPRSQPVRVRPSQDPHHKEVLLVSHLHLQPRQAAMAIHEMKRNRKGTLIAIEDLHVVGAGQGIVSRLPLLEAFVSGFLSLSAHSANHP